ncbi:MAG: hypothetical protein ABW039_12825 [Sphingobium sp.]
MPQGHPRDIRLPDELGGFTGHPPARACVTRATARPAFLKAHADQLAHIAKRMAPHRPRLDRPHEKVAGSP